MHAGKSLLLRTIRKLIIAGAFAVTILLPTLAYAHALMNATNALSAISANAPNFAAGLLYIGGTAMIGSGLLKLKAHVENPTGVSLSPGLGNLFAGIALVALPIFDIWLNSSGAFGHPLPLAAAP